MLGEWWNKQSDNKKIITVILVIVTVGSFFPVPNGNFWTDTITGQITAIITKPIYDAISEQAVSTLQCIDERDGSVAGYSAFEAQIGVIKCN